jgi:hypothetical protein
MTKPIVVSIGAASAMSLAVLVFLGVQGRPAPSTSRSGLDEPIAETVRLDPVATSVPTAAAVTPLPASSTESRLNEPALLDKLHELAATDPPESLRLAREGLAQSPNGPHAPEFAWNVVKSLFNMHRVDEAKHEARIMLYRYPGNSFAADVEHHLLNHPPNPQDLPE